MPLLQLGIPDRFIEHGSRDSCLAAAGLDAAGLAASIERWWALQAAGARALGRRRVRRAAAGIPRRVSRAALATSYLL